MKPEENRAGVGEEGGHVHSPTSSSWQHHVLLQLWSESLSFYPSLIQKQAALDLRDPTYDSRQTLRREYPNPLMVMEQR